MDTYIPTYPLGDGLPTTSPTTGPGSVKDYPRDFATVAELRDWWPYLQAYKVPYIQH